MGLSYPYLTFSVDFANYYHINKKKILKSRKNKTKGIFICETSQYYHMSKHGLKLAEMTCERLWNSKFRHLASRRSVSSPFYPDSSRNLSSLVSILRHRFSMAIVYAGYHPSLNHGVCCGLRNWIFFILTASKGFNGSLGHFYCLRDRRELWNFETTFCFSVTHPYRNCCCSIWRASIVAFRSFDSASLSMPSNVCWRHSAFLG